MTFKGCSYRQKLEETAASLWEEAKGKAYSKSKFHDGLTDEQYEWFITTIEMFIDCGEISNYIPKNSLVYDLPAKTLKVGYVDVVPGAKYIDIDNMTIYSKMSYRESSSTNLDTCVTWKTW